MLDPKTTLSFLTPYIEVDFGISHKILLGPFLFSTLVGDSVIARWLNRNCSVTVFQKVSLVDLVK